MDAFQKGSPKKYYKQGSAKARLAVGGETVRTVIDGETETTNKAKPGDVVLKGPSGEQWLMSLDKFKGRYAGSNKLSGEFQSFKATGSCFAFEWQGESVSFEASWGEDMILNKGDYLCSITETGSDTEGKFDVYRIERLTFKKTYKRK